MACRVWPTRKLMGMAPAAMWTVRGATLDRLCSIKEATQPTCYVWTPKLVCKALRMSSRAGLSQLHRIHQLRLGFRCAISTARAASSTCHPAVTGSLKLDS
ncbi:uncharacterized protein B0H18DRAFT_1027680, partial [Fomitopsis serialis]|uniref:uncharacterized protein n=1 Tax=Fomitopsis serialis TaxID=139415 RepID=UPI002007A0C8